MKRAFGMTTAQLLCLVNEIVMLGRMLAFRLQETSVVLEMTADQSWHGNSFLVDVVIMQGRILEKTRLNVKEIFSKLSSY